MEQWFVQAKKADFFAIGRKFQIDPVIARIIRNRDIVGEEAIEHFLHGDLSRLHDPYLLKDVELAAEILLKKRQEKKKIRIISDYDVDGVVSNYILWTGFRKCGFDADFRIPHRMVDGYGINERLIKEAYDDGIDTIVTCDNGIAAISQIAYGKSLGMTIIVTDHHDVPYEMTEAGKVELHSEADAIVNPKQSDCSYPFDKICGAVVALKLIQVLYDKMGMNPKAYEELVPFAAIATVCDVVDLVDENRDLVKVGLERLPYVNNPGLQALIEVNALKDKKISSYHLGFVIGPCINATGRLESADWAVRLFMEEDPEQAKEMAVRLKSLNEERKRMTENGVKEGFAEVEAKKLKEDDVLIVFLPDCHESLAGIIAGRLKEHFYKPTIVLTRSEGCVKGSGRSIEGYHMFEALNEVKDLMLKFGGHPMAAGMSLEEKNVEEFRRRLNKNSKLTEKELTRKVSIDVPMPIDYIRQDLIEQLSVLEPFGKGNPKPLFAEKALHVLGARRLGANRNVLKLRLQNQAGCMMDALMFQEIDKLEERLILKHGKQEVERMYQRKNTDIYISCTYYPAINEYMGRTSLQIMIENYIV